MFKTSYSRFRLISFIEGLSFLLLVFVAMPIKYLGDNPYPVKIVGNGSRCTIYTILYGIISCNDKV